VEPTPRGCKTEDHLPRFHREAEELEPREGFPERVSLTEGNLPAMAGEAEPIAPTRVPSHITPANVAPFRRRLKPFNRLPASNVLSGQVDEPEERHQYEYQCRMATTTGQLPDFEPEPMPSRQTRTYPDSDLPVYVHRQGDEIASHIEGESNACRSPRSYSVDADLGNDESESKSSEGERDTFRNPSLSSNASLLAVMNEINENNACKTQLQVRHVDRCVYEAGRSSSRSRTRQQGRRDSFASSYSSEDSSQRGKDSFVYNSTDSSADTDQRKLMGPSIVEELMARRSRFLLESNGETPNPVSIPVPVPKPPSQQSQRARPHMHRLQAEMQQQFQEQLSAAGQPGPEPRRLQLLQEPTPEAKQGKDDFDMIIATPHASRRNTPNDPLPVDRPGLPVEVEPPAHKENQQQESQHESQQAGRQGPMILHQGRVPRGGQQVQEASTPLAPQGPRTQRPRPTPRVCGVHA